MQISSLINALLIDHCVEIILSHMVRVLENPYSSQMRLFPGRQWLSYGTIQKTKNVWKKEMSFWKIVTKFKDVIFFFFHLILTLSKCFPTGKTVSVTLCSFLPLQKKKVWSTGKPCLEIVLVFLCFELFLEKRVGSDYSSSLNEKNEKSEAFASETSPWACQRYIFNWQLFFTHLYGTSLFQPSLSYRVTASWQFFQYFALNRGLEPDLHQQSVH